MVDMSLVKLFKGKLDENTMMNEDLPLFLELICQIGNENEDMRREVEDWDKVTQILVMETSIACWLQTKGGKFSCGNGEHANPELTFKVKAGVAKDIFTGALDANKAYMDGSLFLVGSPMDAARFRTMRELVREIFNDITVPTGTPDYVEKAAPAAKPKATAKPAKAPAKNVAKKAAKKAGKK